MFDNATEFLVGVLALVAVVSYAFSFLFLFCYKYDAQDTKMSEDLEEMEKVIGGTERRPPDILDILRFFLSKPFQGVVLVTGIMLFCLSALSDLAQSRILLRYVWMLPGILNALTPATLFVIAHRLLDDVSGMDEPDKTERELEVLEEPMTKTLHRTNESSENITLS